MKIGILTLPLHNNYGGILQAWALQTVLEEMGHRVEVLLPSHYALRIHPLSMAKRALLHIMGKNQGVRVFDEFHRKYSRNSLYHFIRTKLHLCVIDELRSADGRFDGIVVGSDQIWRKELSNVMWRTDNSTDLFVGFADSVKKIAYAASLGNDTWSYNTCETRYIAEELKLFSGVSVREDSAVDILRRETGITPALVLDPTLLLDSARYDALSSDSDCMFHSDGLTSYILDSDERIDMFVNQVARDRKMIRTELNRYGSGLPLLSVEQWLAGFAKAKFVVTDSFHGCVFSLIYRKPFIFIGNKERGNARFDSLVNMFGLQQHSLADFKEYDGTKSYSLPTDIDIKLKALQQSSKNFIARSLK